MAGLEIIQAGPATEAASNLPMPDAAGIVRFTSADGRSLAFKKVPLSRKLRMLGLLGEDGTNVFVQSYALIACAITELDGDFISPPTSRAQIDVVMDRVDEAALDEVAAHYGRLFGNKPVDPDAIKN